METSINNLPEASVMIVGDVMLDRYWQGHTGRISPEAPVPIVHIDKSHDLPGGAGNVALNIAAVGAHAKILGLIGDDIEGQKLEGLLGAKNIECYMQKHKTAPTTTKLRVVSQNQQLLRLDFEESSSTLDLQAMLKHFTEQLDKVNAVILSDYAKGVLRDPQPFIQAARAKDVAILVDPKGTNFQLYKGATILTPNYKEFEAVVGTCHDEDEIISKGQQLIRSCDLKALLITRGAAGMTLINQNREINHFPVEKHEVYDVTGAGDTVISVLSCALATGASFEKAAKLANIAASIAVTKLGAAAISLDELHSGHAALVDSHYGISTETQAFHATVTAKARGERVVMTNGCFDILHAGHVSYLKAARALGDRLIVAVNTDDSVKRLKGESRPINTVDQRMEVLSALEFVDWVMPFSEDTPARIISQIIPDVLVKGGDYKREEIVGYDTVTQHGGQVEILSFIEGCSTTNIINNILEVES